MATQTLHPDRIFSIGSSLTSTLIIRTRRPTNQMRALLATGDPANPRNCPEWRKWSIVAAITLIDLTVSWGASGYSPAEKEMKKIFGVSAEVRTF